MLEFHRKFRSRLDRWLDQGMGNCLMENSERREQLANCFMRFDGQRVIHHAWVIMPNHVHLLFSPLVPVAKLIQAWKGHSARLLGQGNIWQRDYYDTMIRDPEHYINTLRYIRRNPIKAKLTEKRYTIWERGLT